MYANGNRAELPFTAWGLQDWTTYDPADGDYTGSCLPYGLTRSFNAPYPYQILQSDKLIAVLFELNTWHHMIPFAAQHPADDGQRLGEPAEALRRPRPELEPERLVFLAEPRRADA